jgi:hypothetical protein
MLGGLDATWPVSGEFSGEAMNAIEISGEHQPLILHTRSVFEMSDESFFDPMSYAQDRLCRSARTASHLTARILICTPAGSTNCKNFPFIIGLRNEPDTSQSLG